MSPATTSPTPTLWFDSMHPVDLPRVRETWAESIRTRQPFHAEYRDIRPDGTVRVGA